MVRQFEVLFAFDKDYMYALKKSKRYDIFCNRVYDLMNFLRVQLNIEICRTLEEEYSLVYKQSRKIEYDKDIEVWSYTEKIYGIDPNQNGPIWSNINTVIAKYHIYFKKLDHNVFEKCDINYKLMSIIRSSVEKIFKDSKYNELTLAQDFYDLDIEEFEEVKRVFKYMIIQKS